MYIEKIHIENFKGYGNFDLPFKQGLNVLVGDNGSKKSTLLEAINLVLTGHLDNWFLTEDRLNPFLFNQTVTNKYLEQVKKKEEVVDPPVLCVELFFPDDLKLPEDYEGYENYTTQKHKGIRYQIALNESLRDSYEEMVRTNGEKIESLPLEYYKITLSLFSGNDILRSQIPLKSFLIDTASDNVNVSSSIIARIIKSDLEEEDKLKAKSSFRNIKDSYKDNFIHDVISKKIPDEKTTASVDPSIRNSWDSHLEVFYESIPLSYVGQGRQSLMKADVALGSKKAQEARIILIEEPENHLSHTHLSALMSDITSSLVEDKDKQIFVVSHSNFVVNKLGLHNLILLTNDGSILFTDLPDDTQDFFKKLPGYNTLRILLCEKAILVEGDADELIVQKAYSIKNNKKLPIDNKIEVISVNNTYRRFIDIAKPLKKKVAVVLDVDNRIDARKEFKSTIETESDGIINIFFEENSEPQEVASENINYNTLEPLLYNYNRLDLLNKIFGTTHKDAKAMLLYMRNNKADCALRIFNSDEEITFPKYINDAIDFVS